VAGNLAISLIAGTVSFVTLTILDVPFALALSVLMAFFDLIPLVGATIGAVIVGVVTLFNGFPESTIVWTIVQIAYQQVESNVIFPIVYRRTVRVSGLVTIIAVLIGGTLLGVLGALLAIPIAGALQIVIQELWKARRERVEADLIAP
jgi:predicted PurR-regulated permease PerM